MRRNPQQLVQHFERHLTDVWSGFPYHLTEVERDAARAFLVEEMYAREAVVRYDDRALADRYLRERYGDSALLAMRA